MGERSVKRRGSRRSFGRLARRQLAALSLASLVLLLATAGALAVTGALTQPAGAAGCVSNDGTRWACAEGHGLDSPHSVAVSPDGKSVYVASFASNAVVRLNRNPTTGAIAQPAGAAGCISEDGLGPCAYGHGLAYPNSVAVSPDGKSVYVASYSSNAVARFNRNTTTGAITQPAGAAGCVSEYGAGPCGDGHALVGPVSVAVSPDGKSVYVASADSSGCGEDTCGGWGAVARLNRNPTTGAIAQPAGAAGCVSETGAEPCANGHGLLIPQSVAVSPDGKSVYVASFSSDALVRLNRNPTTGAIGQSAGAAGCVSEDGSGPCADGHGLDNPFSVAVAPDGKSVYVASGYGDAVARFNRNTTTGAIGQPAGAAGCVSQTGAGPCADGHALLYPGSVAVSPDGKSVYATSGYSDAVARFNRAP